MFGLPSVKFVDGGEPSNPIICLQKSNQMNKQGFPNPELELVHEVDNEGREYVEPKTRKLGKCVLSWVNARMWPGKNSLTVTGTSDWPFSSFSTGSHLTAYPFPYMKA
jgi:hypothetical protein